jgi:hypothetical protein
VPDLLLSKPDIRRNIYFYYRALGPNKTRLTHLVDFLANCPSIDDASVYQIARVITDWQISPKSQLSHNIVASAFGLFARSPAMLIGALWLMAKYGSKSDLESLIKNSSEMWKHSGFISRQVAALTPLIYENKTLLDFILRSLYNFGHTEALSVIHHYNSIRTSYPLDKSDKLYLMHGDKDVRTYPLPKFLLAVNMLSCEAVPASIRLDLRNDLLPRVRDPIYALALRRIKIE